LDRDWGGDGGWADLGEGVERGRLKRKESGTRGGNEGRKGGRDEWKHALLEAYLRFFAPFST